MNPKGLKEITLDEFKEAIKEVLLKPMQTCEISEQEANAGRSKYPL